MSPKFSRFARTGRFWILCVLVGTASTLLAGHFFSRSATTRGPSEAKDWLAQHPIPTYVAQYEERLSAPGRNSISRKLTVGVRSDGSRAVLEQIYNVNKGVLSHTSRQIYLSSGVTISVWDELRVYSAWRDSAALIPVEGPPLDPHTDCQVDYEGQTRYKRVGDDEVLLGFRSVPLRPVAAGAIRLQSWRLPELGCTEGRRLATFVDHNGSATDSSELVATSISLTAPEARMFDVRQDYEEILPSEAVVRIAAMVHGPPLRQGEMDLLHRSDAYYLNNKVVLSGLR